MRIADIFRPKAEDMDVEITRLAEREQSLIAERQAKSLELAAAELAVGEAYLDRGEAGLADLTRLRVQIEAIDRAITAGRGRRLEATRSKVRAQADQIRRQAEEKKTELARLELETADLLAQLSKLEGVTYTASILSSQPINDWYAPLQGRMEPWFGVGEMVPGPTGTHYATPRSRQLRTEIDALLAQALEIEKQADQVTLEEASGIGDRSAAA